MEIQNYSIGSESGHWYNELGLVKSVPNKLGDKEVRPTLAHARKYKLVPSVTSIIKLIPSPELEVWKCREWAKAARQTPVFDADTTEVISESEWLKMVKSRFEQNNNQAEIGTDIHAKLAEFAFAYIRGQRKPETEAEKLIESYIKGAVQVKVEQPFCNRKYGYGGTIDLYVETEIRTYIIDFKTIADEKINSQFKPKRKHLMQLIAYGDAVEQEWGAQESTSTKYINIYIGRESGKCLVIDWDEYADINEIIETRRLFTACTEFWYVLNRMKIQRN